MEEIVNGILFLFFSFMSLISFTLAYKLYRCPSWQYKEFQNEKATGLVIDLRKNKWATTNNPSEEKALEILQ